MHVNYIGDTSYCVRKNVTIIMHENVNYVNSQNELCQNYVTKQILSSHKGGENPIRLIKRKKIRESKQLGVVTGDDVILCIFFLNKIHIFTN